MALDAQSERNIALKKLFAKAHTGNTKGVPNESIASQISIAANQIIGQSIDSDPAQAVADGVAEVIEVDLVLDGTSNGKSYRAHFPSAYSGAFGAGVAGDPVGESTFAIPFFYNNVGVELDNSGGYTARLFDNGSEVFAVDSRDWVFDPFAVLITSEEDLNLSTTGTMYLYVYTGDTVQDHIDAQDNPHNVTARQVGGITEWQSSTGYEIGDIIYIDRTSSYGDANFTNSIYVCISDHTSDGSSFFNDQANWKVLNSGYEHVQSVASTSWQVDHSLGRFPSVMVTNSSDVLIDGEVEHSNTNRLFVRFNKPLTGRVYCT
tara:strand:+ start:7152 stop:8108 length:957 start_codon:yes stop_codon:yes gene_type:complete